MLTHLIVVVLSTWSTKITSHTCWVRNDEGAFKFILFFCEWLGEWVGGRVVGVEIDVNANSVQLNWG